MASGDLSIGAGGRPLIDQIDRALLRSLQSDARQTNVELAREVGLTEGAVRRRIANLLATGALRIVGVVDPETIGLRTHAVIGLRIDVNRLEQLNRELAAMREISYLYETTGQYDLIVVGFFESNDQLRLFLTQKLARVRGILRSDTFHVMRTVKRSFRWGEASSEQAA